MQSLSTRVTCFWFGLCLCGCLASCSGGNRDYRQGPDPADPSVVYDEPFIMVSGYKTYNGAAFDKCKLCLDKNVKLVLPDSATKVIYDSEPNELVLYMEKGASHGSHHSESNWPIPKARKNMGCAVKSEKGCLLIGTFGEFSYMEGAEYMKLVVHVPKDAEVERRPGLIGGRGGRSGSERLPGSINPGPGEAKPLLTEKKTEQSACWLAPSKEDGWHEIPVEPDLERNAARE